jgi:hypothetical protein
MADVEKNNNGHQHGDRSVEVRVSAQLENLAVVRTVVAAIGTFEDLDFDSPSPTCARGRRGVHAADPVGTTEFHAVAGRQPRETEVVVIDASTTCKTQDILTPGASAGTC